MFVLPEWRKAVSVTISLRKATYTYTSIIERKAFTVNVPSEDYVREADFFGMASGRKVDILDLAGLTPVRSEIVDAPYIAEFPLILECRLSHTLEIGLHTQFIGEILDVKAEESVLGEDGRTDIEKIRPFIYAPEIQAYYATGSLIARAFSAGREIGKGR